MGAAAFLRALGFSVEAGGPRRLAEAEEREDKEPRDKRKKGPDHLPCLK